MLTQDDSYGPNAGRVCLYSHRNLCNIVARAADAEFEDVICEVDDVDLFTPRPTRRYPIRKRVANQLARHARITSVDPGVEYCRLPRDYDLFVAVCMFPRDLLSVNRIDGWPERCRTSICYLEEIWARQLHLWKGHLKILSKFDHVVLNCAGSVDAVHEAIQRPVCYLPPGVDAIRFCPYPSPPVRWIDVYSLGRRCEANHHALLKLAADQGWCYLYDTIKAAQTFCLREHRQLIANIAKRSRYFVAYPAKIDCPMETFGQSEIGYRFPEGIAAGTILIGEAPKGGIFETEYDWPDAVVPVPFGSGEVGEVLAELDSQPERTEAARRNNVVNCLRRHDWAYRWRTILKLADLGPHPALLNRIKRLAGLAEQVEQSPQEANSSFASAK